MIQRWGSTCVGKNEPSFTFAHEEQNQCLARQIFLFQWHPFLSRIYLKHNIQKIPIFVGEFRSPSVQRMKYDGNSQRSRSQRLVTLVGHYLCQQSVFLTIWILLVMITVNPATRISTSCRLYTLSDDFAVILSDSASPRALFCCAGKVGLFWKRLVYLLLRF